MALPAQIGRYHILGVLGQGAMGVVYRARDEGLDREVAVKVIRSDSGDEHGRARFQREARASARLQHPHIVTVYELGEHEGDPFMAMELLEGEDLQRALPGGALADPSRAVPIALQMIEALGHAHARGIVHRDVKPSNVFLVEGSHVKILDFGVARLGEGLTATGMVVGTPHYMSPEQVRAEPVDGRSDLFSAGLILYEMLTGVKVYRPGSVMSVLYQIVNEDADLSRLPEGREWEPIRTVLRKALARDRDLRYPDARALAAALREALQELLVRRAAAGPAQAEPPPLDRTLVDEPVAREASRTRPPAPVETLRARPAPVPDLLPPVPPSGEEEPPAPRPRPRMPAARRGPAEPRAPSSTVLQVVLAGVLTGVGVVGGWWVVRKVTTRSTAATPPAATLAAVPTAPPTALPPSATPGPRAEASAPFGLPAPPAATIRPSPREATPPPTLPTAAPEPPFRPSPPAPAVADGPAELERRLDRANELYDSGRFNAALTEARAALRLDPENVHARALVEDIEAAVQAEAHIGAARQALARGDREGALREVREGLRVKPNDARLMRMLRELEP